VIQVSKTEYAFARWPYCVPVPPNVEELGANKKHEVVRTDPEQNFVPSTVQRLVIVAIDLAVVSSALIRSTSKIRDGNVYGIDDLHWTQ
jgi:hypothetical protein